MHSTLLRKVQIPAHLNFPLKFVKFSANIFKVSSLLATTDLRNL